VTIDTTTALEAAENWRTLARLVPTIRLYLEPRRGKGEPSRVMPQSKPPIDLVASDLLYDLEQTAEFYITCLLMETHDVKRAPDTLEGMLRLIAKRHGHWTSEDDTRNAKVLDKGYRGKPVRDDDGNTVRQNRQIALDFCDDAMIYLDKTRNLVLQPLPPRFMGPCLEACGGDLWLRAGAEKAKCDQCEQEANLADVRDQLASAFAARLMKRSEIGPALRLLGGKTPRGTIDAWIARGRLVPVLRNPQMFRFADAVELAGIEVAA